MRKRSERLICVVAMMIVVSMPGQEAPSKKKTTPKSNRTAAVQPTAAEIRLLKKSSNASYDPGNDQTVPEPKHKPVEKYK